MAYIPNPELEQFAKETHRGSLLLPAILQISDFKPGYLFFKTQFARHLDANPATYNRYFSSLLNLEMITKEPRLKNYGSYQPYSRTEHPIWDVYYKIPTALGITSVDSLFQPSWNEHEDDFFTLDPTINTKNLPPLVLERSLH